MKNKRLFTYVFLFGLLVNGSACGSDHNETDFPETPGVKLRPPLVVYKPTCLLPLTPVPMI